ncbi:MAG: hypothetical protein U0350_16295 [Caldilineaceae bacterium]
MAYQHGRNHTGGGYEHHRTDSSGVAHTTTTNANGYYSFTLWRARTP